MGGCVSSASSGKSGTRGVLLLGLDGAGATTILYQLVFGRRLETIPTLGLNHEIVRADGLELECWDIGGLHKMRPLWRQYSNDADAVIFVVDASHFERMVCAERELKNLYTPNDKSTVPRDRPLLIFANKQDVSGAFGSERVEDILKIASLPVQTYKIFPCTANDRQSLLSGISWLTSQLKAKAPVSPSVPMQIEA